MPYLRRALEIDDSIADAHAGLGTIHMILERDWVSAERELRRGFELGSTLPLWGFWLAAQGRLDEALAVFENNQALDPLAASRRNELAMVHNWRREWDEATHWAKRSLDVDAGFVLAHAELGLAYSSKGGHEEAIDALRRGLDLTGDDLRVRAMLGYAYGAAGREEEAREQLATIRERRSFGTAIARARVHAALGELDEAFLALRDAADERHPAVSWIRIDPSLDALRPDPRFDALVAEIGLTP
jgi:tetratricopeptide (TPR) repeat protein